MTYLYRTGNRTSLEHEIVGFVSKIAMILSQFSTIVSMTRNADEIS